MSWFCRSNEFNACESASDITKRHIHIIWWWPNKKGLPTCLQILVASLILLSKEIGISWWLYREKERQVSAKRKSLCLAVFLSFPKESRKNLAAEAVSLLHLLSKPQVIWKITGLEWLRMWSHRGAHFWTARWPGAAEFCCTHHEVGCTLESGVGEANWRNLSCIPSQRLRRTLICSSLLRGLFWCSREKGKKKILHY